MKKKSILKVFSVLLVFVMLGSLIAACGSSEKQDAGAGGNTTPNAASQESASKGDDGKKTDINIWMWDKSEARTQMNNEFLKDNPQYNIVLTAVERQDMAQKLQTTLASGSDMPDVAWLESSFRGQLLSLDIWEDLSKEPYNFDKSQILDYLIPLESTESGVYVGPEVPSVAGMAYKRALVKEYFGVEEPEDVKKIFTDWDVFLQKGIEVKQKSNGTVFMLASLGDAYSFFKGQTSTPFVKGDVLNLKEGVAPLLEKLVAFKKAGIVDVLDADSPALGASYADDTHIFYPCANWSVEFTIKANDKNGVGRWGFLVPPGGPFPMGGTVQGVPQKAKHKEAAAEYIKYFFLSEKGATLMRDYRGFFAPYKPIFEKPDFYSAKDDYFAGQDVMQAIVKNVFPNIKEVRLPTKYDQDLDDAINLAIKTINASPDGNVNVDELIKNMANDLVNKNPDLKLE